MRRLLLCLAVAACSSTPPLEPLADWTELADPDADTRPSDTVPLPIDAVCGEALVVRRVTPRPGGVDLIVELNDQDRPITLDPAPSLDGAPLQRMPLIATGLTGMLVDGPDPRAATILRALPPGERVVVWHGKDLLAEATTDREHAARRIEALTAPPAPPTQITADAIVAATSALATLGGPLGPVDRTLVVATDLTERRGPVRVTPLAAESAARIAARRATLVALSGCLDLPQAETPATLTWATLTCPVTLPSRPPHLAGASCDLTPPAAPRTLTLVMTAAEAEVAHDLAAADSREPFRLALDLGPGTPIPATAKYRGHTSLECDRKSYALDLDGNEARQLMDGVAHDELFLISMCRDSGYFNQLFGNRLARDLDLFPLGFEVVRLVEETPTATRELGAYLLLEDPEKALRQDMTEPWAILRRRFDPEFEPPDVDFALDEPAARAAWDDIEALAADGVLSGALDSDAYLRWVALNTFLENEDWVDEVFFFAALESGEPYFRVMGWDPDDLFSPCHHGGRFAFDDPHELLYCAEGDLERALLASPEVYARFVAELERLLTTLDERHLATVMAEVRRDLFAVVSTDGVAAAMVELGTKVPAATTAAGFQTTVTAMMDDMLVAAERSRAALLAKIAAWRSR